MFFDDALDDYAPLPSKKAKRYDGTLKRLAYAPVDRKFTTTPFNFAVGSEVPFDTECFRNYWLCAFKHIESGSYFYIDHYGEGPLAQWKRDELSRALFWFKIIGFNSLPYDIPMVEAAIAGASLYDLKELSNSIIIGGERKGKFRSPYNHIDLIEVAPLEGGLKTYAARLHCRRMQELPIDPHAEVAEADIPDVRDYCFNDLDNTELLYAEPTWGLRQYIELRERLGDRYNIDLRSKSDAQVAEAVINAELKQLTGRYPKRPDFDEAFSFRYEPPEWVRFESPQLKDALATVQAVPFFLDGAGSPRMPEAIADLRVVVGGVVYKMGMGGLHSQEKSIAHKADERTLIIDRDVASYYPRIILNNRYVPEHLGAAYLEAYGGIVELRLELKRIGDRLEAGLKIAINGTFGKQGNMYSTIYAPKLLIQTTMTGQLGLLMFIEMVEAIAVPVVSANTDGIVIKCPADRYDDLLRVVDMWEQATGFQTEETRYKAIYSRDVNNYMAVKEKADPKGKTFDERLGVKAKGTYSERGSALNSPLSKNPEALVCNDAVQAFLANGTPIQDTIRACRDIRRFIVVRNVRGGAHKDGWFLGKVIRWYYADGVNGIIQYINSGNKVPNTEGAKPCIELPDELPDDIRYEHYVDRAFGILEDIGYFERAKQGALFI